MFLAKWKLRKALSQGGRIIWTKTGRHRIRNSKQSSPKHAIQGRKDNPDRQEGPGHAVLLKVGQIMQYC